MAAIEASKTRPPARLLTALGIRGVGEVVAEDLMAHFSSLDALAAAPVEELQAIPGHRADPGAERLRLVRP